MRLKNKYPEWVEKYRTKGRTIRKVRDGYGLYACTSVYVKGSHPKSVQEYLGMITEKDGFIPKMVYSDHPHYIEYGLSHFILRNFKRELMRASFGGMDDIVYLGIVMYLFGSIDPVFIRSTFITYNKAESIILYASQVNTSRVKSICTKVEKLLEKRIPDEHDRNILTRQLFLCVVDTDNKERRLPMLPEESAVIIERYGLKYG